MFNRFTPIMLLSLLPSAQRFPRWQSNRCVEEKNRQRAEVVLSVIVVAWPNQAIYIYSIPFVPYCSFFFFFLIFSHIISTNPYHPIFPV